MNAIDFFGVLRALVEHRVDFVVIGGLAARLHGSPTVTIDVDICPAREPANLQRLSKCLRALDARLRGVDEEVPFRLDEESLARGQNFTFTTSLGALDVLAEPAGTSGYADLIVNAERVDLGAMTIAVASIEDLMRMKEASGRPKDRIELEVLGALRDEIDRRARSEGGRVREVDPPA